MLSLALTVEPAEATPSMLLHLRHKIARHVLPEQRLRINRREIKQIYHKYRPKKRGLPPSKLFEPGEQFLDFVDVLDPFASAFHVGGS